MKLTNQKNGEQFDSQYASHVEAHASLLSRIVAGEFSDPKFPQSIYDATGMKTVNRVQVQQGSAGQLFWMHKLASEGAKRTAAPVLKTDLTPLSTMLRAAKANGLKYPRLTLTTKHGLAVQVSLAGDDSRNPGCVYIAAGGGRGGAYYGKVNEKGEFFTGRNYTPEVGQLLTEMARSPKEFARAQGALTGRCCFCNKALDEAKSVTLGYGPTCARKYGLLHTKKAAAKKGFHSGLHPQRDLLGEEMKPEVKVVRRIRRNIESA